MDMRHEVDCQIHSSFSPDAEESPLSIFRHAKKIGLRGVIITDHNTTTHFETVKHLEKKFNLLTCTALEITASYEKSDIHILAYGKNLKQKKIEPMLRRIRESYNKRSKKMILKLRKNNIAKINFKSLLKQSKCGYVTKPVIAKVISRFKKISLKEALSYLERGGIAYVPYGTWIPDPAKVVKLIIKAGGKPIFAHPGEFFGKRSSLPTKKRISSFNKLMKILLNAGLSGMELYYPSHTKKQIAYFKKIIKKHNLLISGGSDWHGPTFSKNKKMGDAGISAQEFLKLIS